MRKQIGTWIWIAVASSTLAAAAGDNASAQTNTSGGGAGGCCIVGAEPATADEARWMAFMREEEKLARDVYTQLNAKWKLRVFDNISRSEQRHFEAVGALLAGYGLADPAATTPPGVFTDPALNSLYNTLIDKGTKSVAEALEVGTLIEKKDIADLESAMQASAKTDLKTVYTNLLAASLSHLEAFESLLEATTAR